MSELKTPTLVQYSALLNPAQRTPPHFETSSWFNPRKGKLKQVKLIRLAPATRSAYNPSLRKIMLDQACEKSSQLQNADKREIGNHPNKPIFLLTSVEEIRVVRYGPTNYS